MLVEQLDWRSLSKLDGQRRATVLEANYTPTDERTTAQQRAIGEANELVAKRARRLANMNIASGVHVPTTNGVTYYRDGKGTPRGR